MGAQRTPMIPPSDGSSNSERDLLRITIELLREQNARLIEELSAERRSSLRLQQELQEQIVSLRNEVQRIRQESSGEAADLDPPRHSWVVRREPAHQNADTVRPPPIASKRGE